MFLGAKGGGRGKGRGGGYDDDSDSDFEEGAGRKKKKAPKAKVAPPPPPPTRALVPELVACSSGGKVGVLFCCSGARFFMPSFAGVLWVAAAVLSGWY